MSSSQSQRGDVELSRIQCWFQAVVTHPDGVTAGADSEEARRLINLPPGQLEKVITRSRALTAAERLAIYANAYHTRLIECLGDVFPMLKRTLGEEAFNGLAFGYLQDYPSRSYTLNELGRQFPRYLSETRPTGDPQGKLPSEWPSFLIDLARLEWAIYEVFDGPGVEGQKLLGSDEVLDVPAERWLGVRLQVVPCLQLLATSFPVNDYYTVARRANGEEMIPIPAPAESFVVLTRRDYVVRRYSLSRVEFELISALQDGTTVGEAVEAAAAATSDGLEELSVNLRLWFRNWTAEGFFQAVVANSA
jgi:hypothetical protein